MADQFGLFFFLFGFVLSRRVRFLVVVRPRLVGPLQNNEGAHQHDCRQDEDKLLTLVSGKQEKQHLANQP